MPLISISDELKEVLDANKDRIKEDYLTYKMFVDSAIRTKLRNMGLDGGEDEIVGHLKKLETSRQAHLDKAYIKRLRKRHAARIARAKQRLDRISD